MSAVLPPDPAINTTLLCLTGLLNHHGRELEPAQARPRLWVGRP